MSKRIEDFNQSLSNSKLEPLYFDEFKNRDIEVFVKRDDLIHPFISGNKWRKLKHHLLKFQASKASSIVTYGGAYSNHLIAVACAGAMFGIKTHGVVRGDELNKDSNLILKLCTQYGMELSFINRQEYKTQKLTAGIDDHGAYHIAEGGAGSEGVKGCAELVDELEELYDHIVLDVGTGTTYAGILQAVTAANLDTVVDGVVVLKNGAYLVDEIATMLQSHDGINLHLDYHFGGFGKWDDAQIEFNQKFTSSTGILVDPVYTGKLFRAVLHLASKEYFKPKSRILVIHTGGMTGVLSGS